MKSFFIPKIKTAVLSLMIAIISLSCQKEFDDHGGSHQSTGFTSVKLFLTDDPSLVFDHVYLDIQKVEIKVEDDNEFKHEQEHQSEEDDNDHHGSTSGGWISLDIHPRVYDILNFRNGLDTLLASGNFSSTRAFKKVRITLGGNNSVVYNNISYALPVKDNDRYIIIKTDDFSIPINAATQFNLWLDFDAGRSIRQKGNSFDLQSEVRLFTKEKAGEIEGRVLPADAAVVVMAINGNDTLTAKPEREGEFKFIGLKAGTYSLIFHATTNNYQDVIINNVIVKEKEDTKMATVTLHK